MANNIKVFFTILIIGAIISCIFIVSGNSKSEYTSIQHVNETLSKILSDSNYTNYDIEKKKELCSEKLEELKKEDYIENVEYKEETRLYEFQYNDGTYGGVKLEPFNKEYSGSIKDYATINENQIVTNVNNKVDLGTSEYPYQETNLKAKIMYGLGYEDIHNEIEKRNQVWNSENLNTSIDNECTVQDFKTGLQGNDVIIVSEHGSFYGDTPVICTEEIETQANRNAYKKDLEKGNIVEVTLLGDNSGNSYYWIKPSFFEENYKNNELKDTIIYLDCCDGFKNDKLVKSLKTAGAECVIGNTETVYSWYNLEMQDAFFYSLLYGNTAIDSLNFAKSIWGNDDNIWAERYIKDRKDTSKPPATTQIYCGENTKLVNLVENEKLLTFEQGMREGGQLYDIAYANYWGISQYYESDTPEMIDGEYYIKLKNVDKLKENYTEKGFNQFMDSRGIKQKGSNYYSLFADRGADITYVDTEVYIHNEKEDITKNKITLIATAQYNEEPDTEFKENKFIIVKENGKWKIDEFTIPD